MPVGYSFFNDSTVGRILRSREIPRGDDVMILFASRGGTTSIVANLVGESLHSDKISSIANFAFDDIYSHQRLVLVIASDANGLPVSDGMLFFRLLEDAAQDFRVSRDALSHLKVSVIGVGSIEYGIDNFCVAARQMHTWLQQLGAQCVTGPLLVTDTEELSLQSSRCAALVADGMAAKSTGRNSRYLLTWTSQSEPAPAPLSEYSSSESDSESTVSDSFAVEDAGEEGCSTEKKQMLTTRQRKELEKEGYKIIGSHSAVKLCRWTKHHTRGRGGCYKHTFYGISSMNCMEATPSLACANKCVFCWRHHKNPVGTSWKWEMDPADQIVREAVDLHTNLIKQLKGVPGVTEEAHKAAMTVKHCALSLVGEPIMYPQINELITELHARRISTFLVTNAQFPGAITTLKPVTQLYVSVDAGNAETLKKTDRPLFKDFWERFIDSFKAIQSKRQRTVYRLTLVKEYNMAEDDETLKQYAELVALGEPDFIEIKAVTFCGSNENDKDNLTMKNVPWHEEVVKFSAALTALLGGEYEIACEHKHSCSVLIALRKFHVNGQWHTWIDYEKFADLALSGRTDFGAEEYWAPTPEWAVYGADERGFDPEQVRHHRKAKLAAPAIEE